MAERRGVVRGNPAGALGAEGFITKHGGNSSKMTLIDWAADGFPVHARYGYSTATDATETDPYLQRCIKGSR